MAKKELPVTQGQELEISIEGFNHHGEGVGRFRGLAVFVPQTIPGEVARIKIKEIKKNFARGELLSVVEPSPHRVNPPCPSFTWCGGSQLQHIAYPYQLELKTRLVEDSLQRIGHISTTVLPVMGMDEPWQYRNKITYQLQEKNGQIILGFYAEETHEIITSIGCALVDSDFQEAAIIIEEIINENKLTAFNWETGEGLLRHVVLRKSLFSDELMAVLVTSDKDFREGTTIAKQLLERKNNVVSVVRNINTSKSRVILGAKNEVLAGKEYLTEKIGDISFAVSANSFFQVNSVQAGVLFAVVKDYAALNGTEEILDVYCGVGAISLYLAGSAKKVKGLEVVPEAIADAQVNARLNGISNTEFVCGTAESLLPEMKKSGFKPDVIILDPPRKGCEETALQAVSQMEPGRIVYVSCDPASLARDLKFLHDRGYLTKEVQPVDMFPQTSHVECVVRIQKKN